MPGRTPQEAVDNFLEPLRDAINVLYGYSRIFVSKKGGYRHGEQYTWTLCGPEGMVLHGIGTFHAEMRFEIVDSDPARHEGGPHRVTTRGYRYWLEDAEHGDVWLIHWHPTGNSPYKEPHIHIPHDLSRHLPTGRITFEKVIAWCIEYGARLRPGLDREGAINKLAECEAPHILTARGVTHRVRLAGSQPRDSASRYCWGLWPVWRLKAVLRAKGVV